MTKAVKLTYTIISINLFIAAIIITSMFGLKSFCETFINLPLNIAFGLLGLYISGYYIGKKIEYQIKERNRNIFIIGVLGLLIIVLIGIISGSTVGFLEEGISQLNSYYKINNAFFDYYFKPFFWILFFGIIPTILTGMTLGYLIKRSTN